MADDAVKKIKLIFGISFSFAGSRGVMVSLVCFPFSDGL